MNVFELLGVLVTDWALNVQAGARPQYPGQSILMKGDNMSAVHWVNKCRGVKEPGAWVLGNAERVAFEGGAHQGRGQHVG